MKFPFIPIAMPLGIMLLLSSCGQRKSTSPGDKITISLSGAFALYPISVKWGEAYTKLHPNIKFNVNAGGAGKGMADVLGGLVDIGNLSRDLQPAESSQGAHAIPVAIDAVVPTINAENPYLNEILKKGLTKAQFKALFVDAKIKSWHDLEPKGPNQSIHVYTRSDAAGAAETFAAFCGAKQDDLSGSGVFGDPGLLQAVARDKDGVGFNNISFAYDTKTKRTQPGIRIIPIDWNGNNKIDQDESYYGTLDSLIGAIESGQYKRPPARLLYFVVREGHAKPEVLAFIKWVLTDGQQLLPEAGYVKLSNKDIQTAISSF